MRYLLIALLALGLLAGEDLPHTHYDLDLAAVAALPVVARRETQAASGSAHSNGLGTLAGAE